MIVFSSAGALLLVSQPDHGVVAGQLARAWGNGAFAVPVSLRPRRIGADHGSSAEPLSLEVRGVPPKV